MSEARSLDSVAPLLPGDPEEGELITVVSSRGVLDVVWDDGRWRLFQKIRRDGP